MDEHKRELEEHLETVRVWLKQAEDEVAAMREMVRRAERELDTYINATRRKWNEFPHPEPDSHSSAE